MELESVLAYLEAHPLLGLAAGLVLAALIAIVAITAIKRSLEAEQDVLKRRLDTLWHEMDDVRMQRPTDGGESEIDAPPATPASRSRGAPSSNAAISVERFNHEKAVYEGIWAVTWALHDRVGAFLRAVEAGENASDSRLSARNAALEARAKTNALRPFYDEQLDDLLSRIIDAEIKAHLAACQYLDYRQSEPGTSIDSYRETFRLQHDGEAREVVSQLVATIRRRLQPLQ